MVSFKTFEQYKEEVWTVLVDATSTELYKFEEANSLQLTICPLLRTCYVTCDNHALQLLRKKYQILQEFPGEYDIKKNHYSFRVEMKNDHANVRRKERFRVFVRDFHNPGIYNMRCYATPEVEGYSVNFDLELDSYDTRDNVLKYLRGALKKGFIQEGLKIE